MYFMYSCKLHDESASGCVTIFIFVRPKFRYLMLLECICVVFRLIRVFYVKYQNINFNYKVLNFLIYLARH